MENQSYTPQPHTETPGMPEQQLPLTALRVDGIDPVVQKKLVVAVAGLDALMNEIVYKIEQSQKRGTNLDARLQAIFGDHSESTEEKRRVFSDSIATYIDLLKGVFAEIEREHITYRPFTLADHPKTIEVPLHFSNVSSDLFFEIMARNIGSQIKNIKKYLLVSYSRYMYGFDTQERNLDALEMQLVRKK